MKVIDEYFGDEMQHALSTTVSVPPDEVVAETELAQVSEQFTILGKETFEFLQANPTVIKPLLGAKLMIHELFDLDQSWIKVVTDPENDEAPYLNYVVVPKGDVQANFEKWIGFVTSFNQKYPEFFSLLLVDLQFE
jgi:hypothetical protein